MSLPLQKFTKIKVQNSNLNHLINCTTSCISAAVGGHDCLTNRSLVSVISLQPEYLFLLFWSFFNQYSTQYSFKPQAAFLLIPLKQRLERPESSHNDYHQSSQRKNWLSQRFEPVTSCSQVSCTFDWATVARQCVNPFPNKPWILCVCSTSLLKTLWEKEKLLIFPSFFSTHLEKFLPFSSNLKLSVANSFSFERSEICLLGKG